MPPPGDDLPRVHVAAGEMCVARKPRLLETVLGSCVAAVIWSRRLKIGGICHGALPQCPPDLLRDRGPKACLRYVDFSIRYLAQEVSALGATREELEVKLFGGADVLPIAGSRAGGSVGSLNCSIALRTLEEENFRLITSDLGGTQGRVIYFNTETGEVFLRRLQASETVDQDLNELAGAL
jgi:chemotaxis protein CheD